MNLPELSIKRPIAVLMAVCIVFVLGVQGQVVTRYRENNREMDVRMLVPEENRNTIEDLESIQVPGSNGRPVYLGDVASFSDTRGPVQIFRTGQVRSATESAQLSGRPLGSVVTDIKRELELIDLSPGYTIDFTGERKQMEDSFASLTQALILAVLLRPVQPAFVLFL